MPDLIVQKNNDVFFIEVKFRANGKFSLVELEEEGNYPYDNARIVLVSKENIKCLSVIELREGKEMYPGNYNLFINRKEFEGDKRIVSEFCNYAVSFFSNV